MNLKYLLRYEILSIDPFEIDQRLKKPLSRWEFGGLTLALLFAPMVLLFSEVNLGGQQAYDFLHYLNSARGDFSFYYYAHWLLPLWSMLAALPLWLAYLIWTTLSALAVFFAARLFGANVPMVILSCQMLVVLYMGQFTGFLIGGLALLWWGIAHKKWNVAGLGLFLAASKYHTGLIPALALLLCAELSWPQRLKIFTLPIILGLLSLIVYPLWPLQVIESYRSNPANDWGSLALWQWIGPAALMVWLPPILLKMTWRERIFALFAATPLGIPYYQQADLLIISILPLNFLPLFANFAFLKPFIGYTADHILVVIPIFIYLGTIIPSAIRMIKQNAPERIQHEQ